MLRIAPREGLDRRYTNFKHYYYYCYYHYHYYYYYNYYYYYYYYYQTFQLCTLFF